jgi:agmatine/peptidylarginine deiminase
MTRQSWVGRIDPHESHFLAIAIAEQQLLHAEFDDCVSSNSSGATCCRTIALIVCYMNFLIVNHSLLVCRTNNNNVGFAAADVPPACASCNSDCARC